MQNGCVWVYVYHTPIVQIGRQIDVLSMVLYNNMFRILSPKKTTTHLMKATYTGNNRPIHQKKKKKMPGYF